MMAGICCCRDMAFEEVVISEELAVPTCLTEAMMKLTLQINFDEPNEIEIRRDFLVIDALKEAKKAKFDSKKKFKVILNCVLYKFQSFL